jgi:argininosuccinate synthase
MAEQNRTPHTRTASYLAEPGEVHRVLLLYSGGLDTSVMLKWIQDEYEAEVVALTVNLGQPGEDYDVVQGKALQLGAVAAEVVDAREEFARGLRGPGHQGQRRLRPRLPALHRLGRPLIAKLAVEYARKHGCDTIAHGCTGKGNDQVRIEATVATLAPELKVIAPCAGGRWGARRRSSTPASTGSRSRAAPSRRPTPSTTTSGGARRRAAGSRTSPRARRRRLPARHPAGAGARRAAGGRGDVRAGRPVALDGERWPRRAARRAAEIGCRHGIGIVDHIEDRIVGLKVRDIYEVPAADDHPPAHAELERLGLHHPPEPVQGRARPQVGVPRLRGAVVGAAALDLDAYMEAVNAQVTGTIGMKLFKGMARVVTRESPNAVYDAALSTFETSGGLFSQQASPGFIELWSLQSRMAHRLRTQDEG